jgi:hypothetical protein
MMRDMVRSEFWGPRPDDRHAESRRVAQSLAQTLVQFELADDDGSAIGGENKGKLTDALNFLIPDIEPGEDYKDDATFKTPMQQARSDGEIYYTPSNSFLDDSLLDGDDIGDGDAGENAVDITAAQLRLQPLLMSCLSVSRERCRDLWSAHAEPHLENALFVSLIMRSGKNHCWDCIGCKQWCGRLRGGGRDDPVHTTGSTA